jgi:hypothetical protein
MSRNVAEAAKGSAEIALNISGVAEAASSTSAGANQTESSAGELARLSADLHRLVGQFRLDDELPRRGATPAPALAKTRQLNGHARRPGRSLRSLQCKP